jgi:hypothetical protein
MLRFVFYIFFLLLFSACARLLNDKKTYIQLNSIQPGSAFLVNHDSVRSGGIIEVERSKLPLAVTVYNDSLRKTVFVRSRISNVYWLNFLTVYYSGFLIDWRTSRKFTYPKKIYVDVNDSSGKLIVFPNGSVIYPKEKGYTTFIKSTTESLKEKNIIKISPLGIIHLTNPIFELSYERRLNQNFSVQLKTGYLLSQSLILNKAYLPNHKGFGIGTELRYYIANAEIEGVYVGFEFSYLSNYYTRLGNFNPPLLVNDTSYFQHYDAHTDFFKINRQVTNLNFKVGIQKRFNRLCSDVFIGLGVRYKDVAYSGLDFSNERLSKSRHLNIQDISDSRGAYWTISVPIGFKLGWSF